MSELVITVDHLRHLRNIVGKGYCVKGSRAWAERHGIDFDKFVREGVPASVLVATQDALALELVRVAQEEENGR